MESLPLWLPLVLFFAAAVLAPLFSGSGRPIPPVFWAVIPLTSFCLFVSSAPDVWAGEVMRHSIPWAPVLGLNLDLWLSPVGLLLALLVTGIGTLIVLYASAYLKGSDRLGRFLSFLFLFGGAMVGLAVSENLLLLFVFWELTSVSSYLLIGHFHEKVESRKSALDALLITGTGGVALLAGVLLLAEAGGSFLIGDLQQSREAIIAHPFYLWAFFCVLLGAITKSAQFPFHFWLPGAMAAPAPVSAYLHSATMVKAGVFLVAILHPVLGGTPLWHHSLLLFGSVTMVWGALVAIVQTDLKRLLAFSTVSALGTLMMLFGMENTLAIKAAMIFFLVHALYKGALFMVAGAIEKATGTRDISQLRGLIRTFPLLGIGAVAAAFSMSGLPPFVGFIAKELLYEVKLETPPIGHILLVAGVIANAANVVVALKVGILPFLGPDESDKLLNRKPQGFGFWGGPLILGIGSLAFGLFPGQILGGAVDAMVTQVAATEVKIKLKLWHGFNLVLLMSAITVLLGLILFLQRERIGGLASVIKSRFGWSGTSIFRSGFAKFLRGAGLITRAIQSGSLPRYLAVIFVVALASLGGAWYLSGYKLTFSTQSNFRMDTLLLAITLVVTAVLLVRSRRRMTSILLLGALGFGIAAMFALYGAPDLAITQILVETLTLLLFALAINGLPAIRNEPSRGGSNVAGHILATLVGAVVTMLTWKAFDVQVAESVAGELAAISVPEAYGRNVVNVILVDFRALDTMGEITVLVIAALGVSAMLGGRGGGSSMPRCGQSPVLAASSKYTAPLMLLFSIFLLLRGHNEPGGGFIGGLVAAMASILVHLAAPEKSLRLFRLTPGVLMAGGLAMAVLSGVPALMQGSPYLTAVWGGEVQLPAVGKVKFGTPLFFDIGVYLVVAGVVLTLYGAMERALYQKSSPRPRKQSPQQTS